MLSIWNNSLYIDIGKRKEKVFKKWVCLLTWKLYNLAFPAINMEIYTFVSLNIIVLLIILENA